VQEKNYKLHIPLKKEPPWTKESLEPFLKGYSTTYYHNFVVVKSDYFKYVFTIFFCGHINITGVKKKNDIFWALSTTLRLVGESFGEWLDLNRQYKIDNITFSGQCNDEFQLVKLYEKLKSTCSELKIRFNPDKFAGMTLRHPIKRGAVILFESGKFSIVGVRSKKQSKFILRVVLNEIYKHKECVITSIV
jgi:TATA-box binding protein (TBP) (component of TFIID and TFIIIB)